MAQSQSTRIQREGTVSVWLYNFVGAPLLGLMAGAAVGIASTFLLQWLLKANDETSAGVVLTLGAVISLLSAVLITFLLIRSHRKWIARTSLELRIDTDAISLNGVRLAAFDDVRELYILRGGADAEPTPIVVLSDGGQIRLPRGQRTTNAAVTGLMERFGPAFADRVVDQVRHSGPVTLEVRGPTPMLGLVVAVLLFLAATAGTVFGIVRLVQGEGVRPKPFVTAILLMLGGVVSLLIYRQYAGARGVTLTRTGLHAVDREQDIIEWNNVQDIGLEPGQWVISTGDHRTIRVANRLANGPLFPYVLVRMRPDLEPLWGELLEMIRKDGR